MFSVLRSTLVRGLPFLTGLLLLACSTGEQESSSGKWTVRKGALQLQENLRVSEGENFYFGSLVDVAVAGDGRMFVLDPRAPDIKMLAPDGTLLDTLGRKGQGPGEFQIPRFGVVARGDSLYVLDSRSNRISVFSAEGTFARSVQVEHNPFDAFLGPGGRQEFVISYDNHRPGSKEDGKYFVTVLDASGEVADTLITAAARDRYPVKEYVSVPVPFGRVPRVAMGPEGRVHFGRSDSLRVASYDLDGTRRRTVRIPFELVPVTEEERENALGDRYQAELASEMPSTKPAFRQFLVDEEGRYWFGRPTADPDSTAWWVAEPEGKRVTTDTLPSDIRLLTVRNGHAYGFTMTEAGAPALVRYNIDFDS